MKSEMHLNSTNLSIIIEGHITGIDEVMQIKEIINSNAGVNTIELVIKDAFVIPSALLGFLVKLANRDGKSIIISEAKSELKNLLDDLDLNQTFLIR